MGCDIDSKYRDFERLRSAEPEGFGPLEALVALESCIREIYGIRENVQVEVDLVLSEKFGSTVNALLEDLHHRFEAVLASAASLEELFGVLHIGVQKTDRVIMQSGGGRQIKAGDGSYEQPHLQIEKMKRFFRVLREINVFPSEISIRDGLCIQNMMRGGSYYYIEIPALGKTVLINPYEREITLVLPAIYDFNTIAELTKRELIEQYGAIDIPWTTNEKRWNDRVGKAITDSVAGMESWDRAEWIRRIREEYTAEDLMEMSFRAKGKFIFYGVPLCKICRIITGDVSLQPVNNSSHLAIILRQIYGAEVPCIEKSMAGLECDSWDRQRWSAEFLKYFPTAEDFLGMNNAERRDFSIGGNKLTAICSYVLGKPVGDLSKIESRKRFACEFYDLSEDEYQQIVVKLRLNDAGGKKAEGVDDRDYYIELFKDVFPEPQRFMGLSEKQVAGVKIGPVSLLSAARIIMGRNLDYIATNSYQRAILMDAVYGEENEVVKQCCEINWTIKTDEFEVGEALIYFLRDYPTPEDFMNQDLRIIRSIQCGPMHISLLMKAVTGADWNENIRNKTLMARFAQLVYGEGHDCVDSVLWSREDWMERVRRDFPTRESIMALSSRKKGKVRIAGKGLTGLMTIIVGRKAAPVNSTTDMSEMADLIYSSNNSQMP